jgi:hypothetical protein
MEEPGAMGNELKLLSDEQMRKFITEGFLLLKTDFSQAFHQSLFHQLSEVYRTEGNPGNNLLPRIPELQKVFDHPVVKGALTSVLGPGYMMHAHRHGHFNKSDKPGAWHKDSYWGYKRMRNHRPWWAMIMYFPQDTPVELGPTGVMPGTQNYETRTFAADECEGEVTAAGEAGTFVLIHYDIWHRATANRMGLERFMLKFEFMRTQAPTEPSWDNRDPEWAEPASLSPAVYRHEAMWRDAWNWLCGREPEAGEAAAGAASAEEVAGPIAALGSADGAQRTAASDRLAMLGTAALPYGGAAALERALEDAFEPVALNAAYGLARMGEDGREALFRALLHGEQRVSRAAAYGLAASPGDAAIGGLIQALASEREDVAFHAAHALGELKASASSPDAVQALAGLMHSPAERLRCAAADALGRVGAYRGEAGVREAIAALKLALRDADAQTRFTAGLSLSQWGPRAEDAVPELVAALDDSNRYVRAHASEALYYIGSEKAKDALLNFLRASRWCPTTTPASTFYP